VSTWLYRILSNVCIDELRRRKATTDVTEARATTPSAAGVIGARVDLGRALDAVPREARVLLALHYVDGLSHRELAAIRGISVNTVKSQLARGKAILRARLTRGPHGSARRPAR
jgi:RNA polymerase sigma-70 factor (ECF subfamily)